MRALSRLRLYWTSVIALALLAGGWVYYRATRPELSCFDGHCPDPGTREYLGAVQHNIDNAPKTALIVVLGVVLVGALIRFLIISTLALRQRVFTASRS